jgi:RNA polymerase sigma-70 factor (ECF subfamily)
MSDRNKAESLNAEDFECLFSRYRSRLYAFVLTLLVRSHDADEVFQATSVVLWKKFDTFEQGTSFWSWACQIAYYEVLKYRRQNTRGAVFADEVIESMAAEMSASEKGLTQREEALRDCLRKLGHCDRQLLDLRYVEGLSPMQIADDEGRSRQSVYRSLNKIHRLLKRCIEGKLTGEI